jgi:KTSC domain
MPRIPIQSTCIKSLGYDIFRKRMEIEFQDGSLYEYFNIALMDFTGFTTVAVVAVAGLSSAGRYFNKYIRPRFLNYNRLR